MAFSGGEYVVTGTATSIASALSIADPAKKHYSQVILRNATAAANDAYWGPSSVTVSANRAGVLKAADTAPTVLGNSGQPLLNINDIYIIGTANAANIVHITLVR